MERRRSPGSSAQGKKSTSGTISSVAYRNPARPGKISSTRCSGLASELGQPVDVFVRVRGRKERPVSRVEEDIGEVVRIGISGIPVPARNRGKLQSKGAPHIGSGDISELGADARLGQV